MHSDVVLDMTSFRPLTDRGNAKSFFEILEAGDELFVPEYVKKDRRLKYQRGHFERLANIWEPVGFVLERSRPQRVTTIVSILPEATREAGSPNGFMLSIPASSFVSPHLLDKLLRLGDELYGFFSPIYGFIRLPWLSKIGAAAQPQWGLPGFGWATWLGPEYNDLIEVPLLSELTITRKPDGGRLLLCGRPENVAEEDASVMRAFEHVLRHVDPSVIQPPRPSEFRKLVGIEEAKRIERYDVSTEAAKRVGASEWIVRMPKFRYLSDRGGRDVRKSEATTHEWGGYGPKGFTRSPEVRAILDELEPDFLTDGVPNSVGGAVCFFGLSVPDAKRLLELLPPEQGNDSLETSPTFRHMVELGDRFPTIRFVGYRTQPGEGERITIEGFYLPQRDATPDVVAAIKELRPDQLEWDVHQGEKVVLVKWD